MNPEGMVALLNYREDGVTRTSRRKLLLLLIELTVLPQLSSPSGSTVSRPSSSRWSCTGAHTVSLSLSFLLVSSVSRIGYIAGGSVPPCMMYHCLYRKIHHVVYQARIDGHRDSSSICALKTVTLRIAEPFAQHVAKSAYNQRSKTVYRCKDTLRENNINLRNYHSTSTCIRTSISRKASSVFSLIGKPALPSSELNKNTTRLRAATA